MSDRLAQMRQKEVAKVRKELEAAIERIVYYRTRYPVINECDIGFYLDGSMRRNIECRGGFAHARCRTWTLGSIFGRELYLYEEVDWERWRESHTIDEIGTGVYGLALTDPEHPTYMNSYLWIGKVDLDKLLRDNEFDSLGKIVWIGDRLHEFFASDDAFRQAVVNFAERFSHRVGGLLEEVLV